MSIEKEKPQPLLIKSLQFYVRNFFSLLMVTAVVFIPLALLDRFFIMKVDFNQLPRAMVENQPIVIRGISLALWEFMAWVVLFLFIVLILLFLFQIALFLRIETIHHNKKIDVFLLYRQALGKLGLYLDILLRVIGAVCAWSLLLIIPGIIVGVLYSFSVLAFLFDGKQGKEALHYSREIIKSNVCAFMIQVAAMLSITLAFYALIIFVLEVVFKVHAQCAYTVSSRIGEGLQDIITIALAIYPLVFFYMLYNELKQRTQSAG